MHKYVILATVICVTVVYLCGCFYNSDMEISVWSADSRCTVAIFMALLSLAGSIVSISVYADEVSEQKKKQNKYK